MMIVNKRSTPKLTLVQRRGNWGKFQLANSVVGSATVWIQCARMGFRVMPPKLDEPVGPNIRAVVVALNALLSSRQQPVLAFSGFDVSGSDLWEEELRSSGWAELSCAHRFVRSALDDLVRVQAPVGIVWHDFLGAASQAGEVLEAAWVSSADPLTAVRRGRTDRYLRDLAASHPRMVAGVVQRSGRPVGVIILVAEGEQAWILDIAVIPEFRRSGLGSELIHGGFGRIAEQGVREVSALIDKENVPSLRLHNRVGFAHRDGPYRTFLLTRIDDRARMRKHVL